MSALPLACTLTLTVFCSLGSATPPPQCHVVVTAGSELPAQWRPRLPASRGTWWKGTKRKCLL